MTFPISLLHDMAAGVSTRGRRTIRVLAWLILFLITGLAATAATAAGGSNANQLQPRVMEYRIGPADVLSISVWKQEGMNHTVTVRPDGMISFPLLGDVRAAGLAPAQLETVLITGLRKYMHLLDGELTVVVEQVHSYTVSVLGEVRTPGRFEFQKPATVLDALAEAGGLTQYATGSKIVILRSESDGIHRIPFNYKEVVYSAKQNAELDVHPGDIVMVP